MTAIQLIVGLGNPGSDYQQTRHNAGAFFVQLLAQKLGLSLQLERKFFGEVGKFQHLNQDVRLLIPTTFMNRSGQAVATIANFYRIEPEQILVVHDELDLPVGSAKLKLGGGHGGHNGLRDTIQQLGQNPNFYRLRLGIGRPNHSNDVSAFVLSRAPHKEQLSLESSIEQALNVLPEILNGNWDLAMKPLHSTAS